MTIVYVITHTDGHAVPQGPIKIGITDSSPSSRLSQLQTGSAQRLSLFACLQLPSREAAVTVERMSHEAVPNFRLSGEWFDLTPTQAVEVIEWNRMVCGLNDHSEWVL